MAARKQYPLRIDPEVWAAVERWAADEMRSANGQVEWILRDALRRAGRLPGRGERTAGIARTNRPGPPQSAPRPAAGYSPAASSLRASASWWIAYCSATSRATRPDSTSANRLWSIVLIPRSPPAATAESIWCVFSSRMRLRIAGVPTMISTPA